LKWTDKFENHYKKFNIDYRTKTFLYSDNLNCDKAIAIHKYCNGRMKDVYGIGTFFTNDFMKKSDPTIKSKALNMVIKLWSMNGKYVVKLGDGEGKEIGEKDALRVAKWTFKNKSLDEK
jgi:nicotinate phosphoribosyltransferase